MDLNFKLEFTSSEAPDYGALGLDATTVRSGLGYQPGGVAFGQTPGGTEVALVFPTLFYQGPTIAALEYTREPDGAFQLSRTHNNASLGNARDYAPLDPGPEGAERLVVVDHGLEPSGGYASWPHGHIYAVSLSDSGASFEQVTENKAFYHSVSAGDFNGDGRTDIVASHMGSNFGATGQNINVFVQGADGGFTEDSAIPEAMGNTGGSGAVEVTNLGGANDDVVEVAYGDTYGEQYAVRVFSGLADQGFEVSHQIDRQGLFDTMGGTRIRAVDLDLDGSKELVTSLEGTLSAEESGYTANGLEILSQGLDGQYEYSTDDWLEQNAWRFETLQFREFEIVDFDHDGFPDLVLNGWGGRLLEQDGAFDIGALLFRNNGEGKLEQLHSDEASGLLGRDLPAEAEYVRVMPGEAGRPMELFFMLEDGSTSVASVETPYREEGEVLPARGVETAVFGRGGDDEFLMRGESLDIDGGAGLDKANYSGRLDSYTVLGQEGQWTVIDQQGQKDTLTAVERVEFDDGALALDLGGAPSQAYRLYQAAFDRAPDAEGLGYWIDRLDEGAALQRAAAEFIGSSEFAQRYGASPSDEAFVEALYLNVLSREPDSAGRTYWLEALDGGLDRGKILTNFSESDENVESTADVIAAGIEYMPFDGV
jgi:hypothetical protein